MEKLLFSLGFVRTRKKGSHAFYRHEDGRTTTVPHHKGKVLARPLIRDIEGDQNHARAIQQVFGDAVKYDQPRINSQMVNGSARKWL